MKERSLRSQLTWAAVLTTFLAMLLSAGTLLAYELMTFRNAWVAELRTQADLIARATETALVFNDAKVAQENLALLKTQPKIRAAAIYGRDSELVAAYRPFPDEPTADTKQVLSELGARFDGSVLHLSYPITHDGERIGTLYLHAQHDIGPRLLSYALILLGVSVGSLALAYYFFGALQKRITSPLIKMTAIAQEVITTSNWALRAPTTEYRDIGVLVDAFNGMLAECGSRTSELERQIAIRERAEHGLRLADRRKDEFLATLAHELRNPLAPMSSALALIEMPAASAELRDRAVTILGRQLRHMVRLIDDLLDASRMATGKLSLDLQPVELATVLRSAVELVMPAVEQGALELRLHLPEQPLYVLGDSVRLTQVFSNLLANACRYTPANGRISIDVVANGSEVEVTVRDTGIGVAPEMQERIFDLFEQVNKALDRGNGGLGIGLTLSRQLILLHSGSLSMHSDGIGCGSSFVVRLGRLARCLEPPRAVEPAPVSSPSLRLLVADDNVDLSESFAALLRAFGHEVEVVSDGAAAVAAARASLPDIALLDIGMPLLNGFQVAERLRADPVTRGIKLVAITGWGQASDKAQASAAGFDFHMVKPVTPEQLESILAKLSTRAAPLASPVSTVT